MANSRSARKRIRTNTRKHLRNKMYRSRAKTVIKKAETAIYDSQNDSTETVQAALRTLDKAAGKGILHPNNVARRKSRLVKKLRLAQQAEATA